MDPSKYRDRITIHGDEFRLIDGTWCRLDQYGRQWPLSPDEHAFLNRIALLEHLLTEAQTDRDMLEAMNRDLQAENDRLQGVIDACADAWDGAAWVAMEAVIANASAGR